MTDALVRQDLDVTERRRREVEELGPWFHNLHLPDGLQTAANHALGDFPAFKWRQIASYIPQDLRGWRALDIGCNAGFYSFELARRGAEVLGIDSEPLYLRQAQWAAAQFQCTDQVEFRQMQVYDLARVEEQFDLVLFLGVLYHLRYPMLGLDIVSQKVRRLMVFQTLTMPGTEVFEDTRHRGVYENRGIEDRDVLCEPGWPKLAFIEHSFANDRTNWWIPNHAGAEAMLRSSGMRVVGQPGHEIYMCEPDREHPSCATTWNAAEFRSAAGLRHP